MLNGTVTLCVRSNSLGYKFIFFILFVHLTTMSTCTSTRPHAHAVFVFVPTIR